jgi:phage terminase large subunit-like protein
MGLRIGKRPRTVVTTTPKPNALTRVIRERAGGALSTWPTYDNEANLAESFRRDILDPYRGTRIGRQELMGELLEDVEGAMWKPEMLEDRLDDGDRKLTGRVAKAPECSQLVVAVDPTGADNAGADECGIVVVGKGEDGHGYVLADWTLRGSPKAWAAKAVQAYHHFKADKIVAETNFGAQMVADTIQTADRSVPVGVVRASRSKRQRAEPVVAMYEQGRIHHVGPLPKLEDELLTWEPEANWSPGRMDALVWGVFSLNLAGGGSADAWHEAMQAILSRTPTEELEAQRAAQVRLEGYRARAKHSGGESRCSVTPDRHHRWDAGTGSQCKACLMTRNR